MSESKEQHTPSNPEVLSKYQAAAAIANSCLDFAIKGAVAGADTVDLCRRVDEEILAQTAKVFSSKKRGIAFPCAISTNNLLCHHAPLEPDSRSTLRTGDLVKIELGVHIDGFPALVANSAVVGATKESPATGLAADAVQSAHLAAEAALRLIRPGNSSSTIRQPLKEIAASFNTRFVEGMISHSVSKDLLASGKALMFNPTEAQQRSLEECQFEEYDVFIVDIAVSTGEGKTKPSDIRTTIYCKTGSTYSLKLKTSRAVFSEIQTKFGSMAFNVRSLEDQVRSRMALSECASHNLVTPYEVIGEKEDALTARFMFTTVLMPSGPLKLTDYQFNPDTVKSVLSVQKPELLELLSSQVRKTKKEKKAVA